MKLVAVPFQKRDLENFEMRPYEKSALPIDWVYCLDRLNEVGPVKTIKTTGGQVITIVGIKPTEYGAFEEGEVWQVPAQGMAEKYSISFCRLLRELENDAVKFFGFKRLFSWCPADGLHDRWMRFMGYHQSDARNGDSILYFKAVR